MGTENNLSTQVTEQDLADAVKDKFGVLYSRDGKRLLKCDNKHLGVNYSIQEGTEVICENAFDGCERLLGISIPDGVTTIGDRAFYSTGMRGELVIPNSVTTIGDFAFGYCVYIEAVTLGEGVAYIADSAFTWIELSEIRVASGNANFRVEGDALYSKDMTTLVHCWCDKSFEIPKSVKRIAGHAFELCQALESITIPAGVTEIGRGAFARCTHLVEFKVEDGNEHFCAKDGVLYSKDMRELICHPINIYSRKAFTVPESVVKIWAYAFECCWYLCKITIHSGVEEIGECTFDYINDVPDKKGTQIEIVYRQYDDVRRVKYMLREVLLEEFRGIRISIHNEEVITNMETERNCLLTQVKERDLVTGVKDWYGVLYSRDGKRLLACRKRKWNLLQKFIRRYSVKQGTEVICDEAFVDHGGCERLEEVRLPESVKAIGKHAFRGCSRLRTMTIGSNVTLIGDYAFQDCSGLTEVRLPDSVREIGKYAFSGCSRLRTMTIGSNVTLIGDYAFQDCKRLTQLNFNATACSSVGQSKNIIVPIFEGCVHLTKASIGDNVTVIPPHLFYNCTSLREVQIGRNVREIGSEAFLDCMKLKRVSIPTSVTDIGGGAFDGCLELAEIEVAKENAHYCSMDCVLYSKDMSVLLRFPSGSPLKEFSVPESVKDIGDLAFSSCANLRKVTLPCGLKSIGEDCFLGSKKIKLQVTCPPNGIKTSLKTRFEDMLSGQDVDTVKVM